MISNLELSKLFWVSLAFVYVFLILVVYSIVTLPENTFSADSSEQVMVAVKLTYVRLSLAVVSSVVYPILLFSSLKYTKYVTIALTVWAVAMYIDDNLVLYSIIGYPSRGVVVFLLSIRPICLACLVWMSFELTYTKSKAR